jgi:hypothetical protein
MLPEEPGAVPRVQCQEDGGFPDDLDRAQQPNGREPDEHDRAEDAADPGGAVSLEVEEQEQQEERRGNHVWLEGWRRDPEALGRAQHRDRRRDDAVAVEQRRA